jgi:hypothetical protein
VVVDRRTGHSHGGGGFLDGFLEQGRGELLGRRQHIGRTGTRGSRVQADDGVEVDHAAPPVFGDLAKEMRTVWRSSASVMPAALARVWCR